MRLLVFLFISMLGIRASAQEVEWREPRITASERDRAQGQAEVTLRGVTTPGATIVIDAPSIAVLAVQSSGEDSVRVLPKEKVLLESEPFAVAADGSFEIRLRLPFAISQIPLRAGARSFQISVEVTRQGVVIQDQQRQREYVKRHSIWFGLGLSSLSYSQAVSQTKADLSFTSIKAPSTFLEGRYLFSKTWQGLAFASLAPGEASSGGSVEVRNGAYRWMTLGAEVMWLPEGLEGRLFNRATVTGFRIGIQSHSIPYLSRVASGQVEMREAPLKMATFGLRYYVQLSRFWGLESFLRYQQALSSSVDFEVKPTYGLDWSLGAMRTTESHFTWGAFWYGQAQGYKFSQDDRLLGARVDGTQSVLFTTLELRAAYVFN